MAAVQEKYGTLRGKGLWKLPTGLVLAGELRCAWSLRATKHAFGCSRERGIADSGHVARLAGHASRATLSPGAWLPAACSNMLVSQVEVTA